jgi:alkylation response protein AidB-like acyl-CoA dehydrogenase
MYTELLTSLTPEQASIRDTMHAFAREVLRPAAKKLDHLPAEEVPRSPLYRETMKKGYELGIHTILLPEAVGGMGLDPVGIHIVLEELGWGSSSFAISLVASSFPALACLSFAPESMSLIERFVLPFCRDKEGKVIGCWALTEPDHGSDWIIGYADETPDPRMAGGLTARKDGQGWVLNGQKSAWVSNGPVAAQAVLFVSLDRSQGMRGSGIALVDLDRPGISRGKPWDKIGQRALPQGEIYFDDVRIPAEQMLVSTPDFYAAAIDASLALANSAMGAVFTGVARAAFEEAVRYTGERVQGGVPIHRHQAVQVKLFQLFQRTEVARAISRRVMTYNYSTRPPILKYAVASKVSCTEAAFSNAHDAVNLFGGMGLSRESDIEMIFRDARASMIEDGINETLGLGVGKEIAKSWEEQLS